MILTFLMTMCIGVHTQDVVKHGIIFKHENSLPPNSWYNIIITIFMVFLISLTIRALLTINYGKLLKRKRINTDAIEAQEMHQLNPTAPDDI